MAAKMRYSRAMLKKAILGDPDVKIRGADGNVRSQGSSMGVKATVCARLGCSRQTLDNYLKRYEELEALLEAEGENIVDTAETKLLGALNNGDMRAILFVLETKGKKRGWSKRTEVTGADGAPLGLPADVIEMMSVMGVKPEDVIAQFAAMVREQAAGVGHG